MTISVISKFAKSIKAYFWKEKPYQILVGVIVVTSFDEETGYWAPVRLTWKPRPDEYEDGYDPEVWSNLWTDHDWVYDYDEYPPEFHLPRPLYLEYEEARERYLAGLT